MPNCATERAVTGLLWALTACGVEDVREAAVDGGSSDNGAASSSTTTSADDTGSEASTDPGADSSSEAAESESSTTSASVDDPRVQISPGVVDEAELVKTLPVARMQSNAERRVVLRLDPSQLPSLETSDRLRAGAEVQVTTRCDVGQNAPGCDYDPQIGAQLLVTTADGDSTPMSDVQTQTCSRTEHHCMFVFRPVDATVLLEGTLDVCEAADECRVELVMWAWDVDAREGGVDEVLVGENEGDYLVNQEVSGDKARLVAVRERGELGELPEQSETIGAGTLQVPTDASPTLVYSHLLAADGLLEGEQFLVEAKIVTSVSSRARVSSKMFVTTDPEERDGGGLAATAPKQIGEHNGVNCTTGDSPCTTRKVAVFRATEDIDGAVYVNVMIKSAVPGGGSANVAVQRDAGWIRATKYGAELEG